MEFQKPISNELSCIRGIYIGDPRSLLLWLDISVLITTKVHLVGLRNNHKG